MRIEILIKSVYGKATIYPANELAKQMADLLGQRTFTASNITKLKAMGFELACNGAQVEGVDLNLIA